jgi:Domain of unknown function (DUF222)
MSSRGLSDSVGVAGEAFDVLAAALDGVAGVEWWRLSEAELGRAAALLHRAESRCAAGGVAVLAEAVERGAPISCGQKDGARWYRALVPVTPSVAKGRSVLAAAFGTLAKPAVGLAPTRESLAAGDISVGHATVIVRTMEAVEAIPGIDVETTGEAQALMVETAEMVDPAQLGRAGQRLRHRLDPRAAERLARDEDAQHAAREAYMVHESSGMWRLSGHLPPVIGATLMAALDPLAGPEPATDGTPDPRPHRVRMADAFGHLATLSLAQRAGAPGGLPRRAGAATRMIVTADLSTLTADVTSTGGQAGAAFGLLDTGEPGGWEISPLTTQVLSCGAEVIPMLLDDETGRPLDVGRTQYPFTAVQRRAIEVRDQHCTYPGCTAKPAWCDTHHLLQFSRGGRTAEANGALVCGWHHRFVHAHGWIGRLVDGHVLWRAPSPLDDAGDDPKSNARLQLFERALRDLAQRWINRTSRQQPHDTG